MKPLACTRRAGLATGLVLAAAACGGVGQPAGAGTPPPASPAAVLHHGQVPAPEGDAFYAPPLPLPHGQPGDILWSRKIASTGQLPGLGVEVVQMLYLSTDALGRPDAVSGTVILPSAAARSTAPVVGFATGTEGLGDTCAPSRTIAAGTFDWTDHLVAAARHGWAVAVTDYEGLGTPGDHTYSVGRSEGHAVLDAVRAAQRLRGAGLRADTKVAFWGYSQGGGAATWAGQLAPAYAPELRSVAVAAGGVPADLTKVSEAVDGRPWAGAELMSAIGFAAAYPELRFDDAVQPAFRPAVQRLRTECIKQALPPFAGKHVRDILTADLLHAPPWQARLTQNSLGATPPTVPILLYHGTADTVVAFDQAEALARRYCAEGVDVTWRPYAGEVHGDAWNHIDTVTSYLTDRFAGTPATPSCLREVPTEKP
ncbi:lipase family protein [Frankia sp. AgB32]|uniref:lipase family protein n=1 Tax=Frankia sp. AgB32 TaxID=631119 RepID=UPI0020103377|nr:lipase family protein [Frankia sp. AgB32]MCK9898429.1 lipase family protein [Frankia sp. AgB32]